MELRRHRPRRLAYRRESVCLTVITCSLGIASTVAFAQYVNVEPCSAVLPMSFTSWTVSVSESVFRPRGCSPAADRWFQFRPPPPSGSSPDGRLPHPAPRPARPRGRARQPEKPTGGHTHGTEGAIETPGWCAVCHPGSVCVGAVARLYLHPLRSRAGLRSLSQRASASSLVRRQRVLNLNNFVITGIEFRVRLGIVCERTSLFRVLVACRDRFGLSTHKLHVVFA